MGGNVFKGKTRRLDKAAYEQVAAHAAAALRELYPSSKVSVIPSYGAKCDFGDLDVLISDEGLKSQEDYENLKRMTQEHFGAVGWERNGPVASVDYHKPPLNDELGFQVDLIKQDARTYEYGLAYFSFNDLGNLLGRIAHAMGVSHRHDGLYWYFRDSTYLFKEIELTIDPAKTLTFLGLPQSFTMLVFEMWKELLNSLEPDALVRRKRRRGGGAVRLAPVNKCHVSFAFFVPDSPNMISVMKEINLWPEKLRGADIAKDIL